MKDKRRFPRYDVSEYPEIKASTASGPMGERLMTISAGGAGFWAPSEDFNFKLGQKVAVTFQIEGVDRADIELRGEVLYIAPHPFESQIGRLYGIKFEAEAQGMVRERIDQLHLLYEEGRIKMA